MFDILLKNFLTQFREHLVLKQRSEETIRGYVNDITQLDRFLFAKYNSPISIENITSDDIEDYLFMLQTEKNYAVASINRNLHSIRAMYHFASKKKWVKEDVSKEIEPLKREHKERIYLTEKELHELLTSIPHPLIALATRTMAYTGLRVSECMNLTIKDVDVDNDLIYIIEGKGKKDRIVPIAQSLKPYLLVYIDHWRVETKSNNFFATKKTGKLSQQYINRMLRETTKKLGWKKKVTCHILRHTFASLLVEKDGSKIAYISKILGHSDLRTTMIYVHSNQKQLKDTVDLLE